MATPPDFSVGQVLTAAHMDAVGLWLVKSDDFTTADPLDTLGVFSSDFVNYKVYLTYYGSASSGISLQYFSGTNTLYSGNNYYRYGFAFQPGGSDANLVNGPGTSLPLSAHTATSSQQVSIEMLFFHPNDNSQRKYIYANWFDPATGNTSFAQCQIVDNTAFTGFRLDAGSGSITGKLRVYGLRD